MGELSYRNFWVSLAIVMPLMAIGMLLLRNDPVAREYVGLAAIVGSTILLSVLDQRERRRKGLLPSQQRRP